MYITAREIVDSAHVCPDPEMYSGRRATISDLNEDKLFTIYMRIKKEIGDGHENDFIAMIQDLDSLAATKFLYSLYLLESNEWKYEKKERKESNIDLGPGSVEMVIATVYGSVVHGNRDDTDYIRKKFFLKLASEGEIDIKYAKFLIQNSARVS